MQRIAKEIKQIETKLNSLKLPDVDVKALREKAQKLRVVEDLIKSELSPDRKNRRYGK